MHSFIILVFSFACLASAPPLRWVSTSPQITEFLFQLKLDKHLVATSNYSLYPKEAEKIPVIGKFTQPSIETTLRYSPDLILLDDSIPNHLYSSALKQFSLNTLSLSLNSMQSIIKTAELLLEKAGEKNSPTLTPFLALYEKLKSKYKKPFTFLAFIWPDPNLIFGHSIFLSKFITDFGGVNIFPSAINKPYATLSEEWLSIQKPDYIFMLMEENDFALKKTAELLTKFWGIQKPEVIFLAADDFSRSSFTPLLKIEPILKKMNHEK